MRELIFVPAALGFALLLIAAPTSGQGVCDGNPQLASCQDATLTISAPRVLVPAAPISKNQSAAFDFVVNVSYVAPNAAPGAMTTVSVTCTPAAGFGCVGRSATATAGATASVPVSVTVSPDTSAGTYSLSLRATAMGTNSHRSASGETSSQIDVPLVVRRLEASKEYDEWHTWGLLVSVNITVDANGPVNVSVSAADGSGPGARPLQPNVSILHRVVSEQDVQPYVFHREIRVEGAPPDVELRFAPEGGGRAVFADPPLRTLTYHRPSDWWGPQALFTLFAVVAVGEAALGVLVLTKGGGRLPARLLGLYLVLHPLAYGTLPIGSILNELRVDLALDSEIAIGMVALTASLLPSLDILFAVTYPTTMPTVARRPYLFAVPLVVSATIFATLFFGRTFFTEVTGPLSVFGYLLGGALFAGLIFWRRAKRAATTLERSRLRYMMWVIAFPMAFLLAAFIVTMLGAVVLIQGEPPGWFVIVPVIIITGVVLVPAVGLGYGVLKYHLLDIDLKVRFALSKGALATIFLAVFFVVSQLAQNVLSAQYGLIAGGIAAGLLLFALAPLQRAADRLADRVVPVGGDAAKYQEFRRWEVYRATFEDLSADAAITERERRALEALAKNLRLKPDDMARIEAEVARERGATRAVERLEA
ncbi:MAG: hypothetical protein HY556_01500 [Euryarchaeota archaeon]|nr:hypothetical protein [Euryarchaeota archaeon]